MDDDDFDERRLLREEMLATIERQIEEKKPEVTAETLTRLMAAGMPREEAIVRMARVLSNEMFHVMKDERPYDEVRYVTMMQNLGSTNYASFSREELVDLLAMEEDRLPREVVDEFVRRGESCIEELTEIVEDEQQWVTDDGSWWAIVHAVYILGAIGGEKACPPLLRALVLTDQYDVDWIADEMPSILGNLPSSVANDLRKMVEMPVLGWYARCLAAEGLAALTIRHPEMEGEVFSFLGEIFLGEKNENMRALLGALLLDFQRTEWRDAVVDYGKTMRGRKDRMFGDREAAAAFHLGEKDLDHYRRDWLHFYDPEEITRRQRQWAEEDLREKLGGEKIGRNEPCPCGSGKKFKKCCLEKMH
jgi:hypothetical protein